MKTFTMNRSDQRLVFGIEWDVEFAGNPWVVTANVTASDHSSQVAQVQDTLSTHMELALNGWGGPNCDLINGVLGDGNTAYAASGGDFGAGSATFLTPSVTAPGSETARRVIRTAN